MDEIINPKVIVIPRVTKAVRDTLKPEVGTLYFNTDSTRVNICRVSSVGSTAWTVV